MQRAEEVFERSAGGGQRAQERTCRMDFQRRGLTRVRSGTEELYLNTDSRGVTL